MRVQVNFQSTSQNLNCNFQGTNRSVDLNFREYQQVTVGGEEILNYIDDHNKSETAHSDIRESINDLQETVDNLELSHGQDGKDGISATHSWNGTVLTITSASGTSSADLKGANGKDGYTPQKGVDYWTTADLQAMVNEVIANLPNAEGVGF
jgi:hypothetical protein